MYPSSNLTGEASIHHYGNFSYLAEFSIDGLKINEKKNLCHRHFYMKYLIIVCSVIQ